MPKPQVGTEEVSRVWVVYPQPHHTLALSLPSVRFCPAHQALQSLLLPSLRHQWLSLAFLTPESRLILSWYKPKAAVTLHQGLCGDSHEDRSHQVAMCLLCASVWNP